MNNNDELNQETTHWHDELSALERVDVQTAWNNAIDLGTVHIGKGVSATGNLLAVFNELRKLSAEWTQKLDIRCNRTDNKYMQMKKMVDYFG